MTYDLNGPWNLPPKPSWCGTSWIAWAQQAPEERKAEWLSRPASWHESVGVERIEYWSRRSIGNGATSSDGSEYRWTLDPLEVQSSIEMLRKGDSIECVATAKGVSVTDLRRDLAMLQAADFIRIAARKARRKR